MALTFTEMSRANIGGKAFRAYEVTLDGTINSITAANLGLNHIDAVQGSFAVLGSAAADVLPILLTQEDGVSKIEISATNNADKLNIWVVGW